jgi:hypothetical protein
MALNNLRGGLVLFPWRILRMASEQGVQRVSLR